MLTLYRGSPAWLLGFWSLAAARGRVLISAVPECLLARGRKISSLGFSLLVLLECRSPPELVLTDTEGRSFSARCDEKAKTCRIRHRDARQGKKEQRALLRSDGRILGVCDDEPSHAADCRALVCEGDAQCPPLYGSSTGSCVAGLCIDASRPVVASDAVMLCLAGTGLGHDTPQQIERYALALNCGAPCRIPTPCRQP